MRTQQLSSVTFFCQKHFKLLLALFLFGLAVVELASLHPLMAYDLMAHDWMQGFRSCALDRAALFLKYWTTTPYPTVVFAVFLASWLAYGKNWQSLATFAIIVIGGALLSEWFKELVARPRPSALWFVQDGNSFPSGHVTTASTIFGAAYYCIGKPNIARPWHRALLLIFFSALVLLIAFQRIYFTHHWVSDAVGGGLLGIGWCFFVIDRFGRYVTMRSIRTMAIVFAIGFVTLHMFPDVRVSSPAPTTLRESPAESVDLAAYTPNMVQRRDRRLATGRVPDTVWHFFQPTTIIGLPLRDSGQYYLTFNARPQVQDETAGCRTIDFALNDNPIETLVLHNGWRDYRVLLDQHLVTNGNNRLTIHIGSGIENSVLLANIALHHR